VSQVDPDDGMETLTVNISHQEKQSKSEETFFRFEAKQRRASSVLILSSRYLGGQ